MHDATTLAGKVTEEMLAAHHGREAAALEKYGWFAHVLNLSGGGFDAHTHGLRDTCGHTDFQIVLACGTANVMDVLQRLAERVLDGEVFAAGQTVPGVCDGRSVRLVCAREGGRDVLRVILPDSAGNLDPATLAGEYLAQYHGTLSSRRPRNGLGRWTERPRFDDTAKWGIIPVSPLH